MTIGELLKAAKLLGYTADELVWKASKHRAAAAQCTAKELAEAYNTTADRCELVAQLLKAGK